MTGSIDPGERDFDHLLAELEACRGEIARLRGERDATAELLVRWVSVANGLASEMRLAAAKFGEVLPRLQQTILAAPSLEDFDQLVAVWHLGGRPSEGRA